MSFLTTSIHRVSKVSISAARELERQDKSNKPLVLIRDIIITGEDGETYEISLFSNKDESLPLEVS